MPRNDDKMITVTTIQNQTVLDLALQLYGNADAVGELLALNRFPDNDVSGFNVAKLIGAGVTVSYDETSSLMNKRVLQELASTTLSDQIASYAPVFGRCHKDVQKYLSGTGIVLTLDEVMAIDRLVRDLNGEKNIDYSTNTNPFNNIHKQLYPLSGSVSGSYQYDVFMSGRVLDLSYFTANAQGLLTNTHGLDDVLNFEDFVGTNFCAGAFINHDHYSIVGNATNIKFYKNKMLLHTLASNVGAQVAVAACSGYYVGSNMLYKAIYLFEYNNVPYMNLMDDFLRAFQTSLNRL